MRKKRLMEMLRFVNNNPNGFIIRVHASSKKMDKPMRDCESECQNQN